MNSKFFLFPRASRPGCAVLFSAFAFTTLADAVPRSLRHASARDVMTRGEAEPIATDALRPAERAFFSQALVAVRQQLKLAEVGASQAERTEVRSHALQLAADYRALNEALDALMRRKGGLANAPVGGTSENYQKLFEQSGAAFDREFVRIATELSTAVLAVFEKATADVKDVDVRELAASELPVLRAHRNTETELKKQLE